MAQVHWGPCFCWWFFGFCLWWVSMIPTAPFTSLHRSLWDKEASRLGHGQITSNGQIKATTPSHLIIQSSPPSSVCCSVQKSQFYKIQESTIQHLSSSKVGKCREIPVLQTWNKLASTSQLGLLPIPRVWPSI